MKSLNDSTTRRESTPAPVSSPVVSSTVVSSPEPIAIVGMACAFPGAPDLAAFWRLIAMGKSAITDAPPSRLQPEKFGLNTRRGGFLDEPIFDPIPLGIMPAALDDGDAEQFLLLSIVHSALRDAGIESLQKHGERSEIIVGRGGYMNDAGEVLYMSGEGVGQILELLRGLAPELSPQKIEELRARLQESLPHLSSEAVACTIPNLVAGRVANRLDCQGASYTVDAACASSLIALDHVVRDLRSGRCDVGLAAGIHIMQKPYFWRAFETLGGVSTRENYAPFDADSDGLMMGEGVGALVLKRQSDALRDGDRIYALVRGVGVASDGRGQGLMAPRLEGQVLALRRAYEESGVAPETVSLVEAHGTGTVVGDATELDSMHAYFGREGEGFPAVALGTVKSQIGHAMPAAGMAGIIKAALSVAQGVLPPTINVQTPHPKLQKSRFYLNNSLRPWLPIIRDGEVLPLRAGVNAFGFGGINAHAILESAPESDNATSHSCALKITPRNFEIFVLAASTPESLLGRLELWLQRCAENLQSDDALRDASYTAWRETQKSSKNHFRIAIIAASLDDLNSKLEYSRAQLVLLQNGLQSHSQAEWTPREGVYFRSGDAVEGKLAVLFPGIGFPGLAGGYTSRLAELSLHFPIVRDCIIEADLICEKDEFSYPLRHQFFPPPFQDRAAMTQIERELGWSSRTLPGMMAANMATWELLRLLKIEPDALAGFSLGEWSALVASGAVGADELMDFLDGMTREEDSQFSFTRNEESGAWAMIAAPPERVEAELEKINGVLNITIDTSPHQVFIGGETHAVREAVQLFKSLNIWAQQMPFPAVHTPLAAEAVTRLRAKKNELPIYKPKFPVYNGAGGAPYPDAPEEVLDCLFGGISEPVRVRQTVTRLYEDGVRIFVQVGSGGKMLANLRHTFGDAPYEAVAMDLDNRGGLEQFLHCAAQLFVCGVPLSLDEIFAQRNCRDLDSTAPTHSPSARVLSLTPPRLHADESTLETLRAAIFPPQSNSVLTNAQAENDFRNGATHSLAPTNNIAGIHHPVADAMLTMQQFLALQQQNEVEENFLFAQFLQTQSSLFSMPVAAPVATTQATPEVSNEVTSEFLQTQPQQASVANDRKTFYPLLGDVLQHEAGRFLTTRLVLNLADFPLLEDHCLLRLPPELGFLKPIEERLPTLPMTASLEILCEAASTLAPGWQVVACHDVEARRWIALESAPTQAVQISAQCVRAQADEVEVAVEIRTEKNGALEDDPALLGRVTLRHKFSTPPAPFEVRLDQPCPRPIEDYYYDGPLFHGPRFHVIEKLCAMSDEAVEAILEVPDPQRLFGAPLQSAPILDAALLDGLGQVLGYPVAFDNWAVFPQKLARLERFAPTPPVGSAVRCVVSYKRLDARRLIGDVDAFDENGNLWLRISNWLDWRVLWPKEFLTFDFDPRKPFIGALYEWSAEQEISCRTVSRASLNGVNSDWYARLYLRPSEWQEYSAHARFDWLLGRIAVKDAVRDFLQKTRGQLLHPLEIEIANDESGQPIVIEPTLEIQTSISHLADEAIAVAAQKAIGVDLARLEARGPEWSTLAFTANEREVLGASDEWLLRGWCAKEAAMKSRGAGLDSLPQFQIESVYLQNGEFEIRFGAETIIVQTQFEKNRALALCVS